jgi:hypothetical protein
MQAASPSPRQVPAKGDPAVLGCWVSSRLNPGVMGGEHWVAGWLVWRRGWRRQSLGLALEPGVVKGPHIPEGHPQGSPCVRCVPMAGWGQKPSALPRHSGSRATPKASVYPPQKRKQEAQCRRSPKEQALDLNAPGPGRAPRTGRTGQATPGTGDTRVT